MWKLFSETQPINELLFNGFYYSHAVHNRTTTNKIKRTKIISSSDFLKFHEDGLVITASITCNNTEEDLTKIRDWFNRDWKDAIKTKYNRNGNNLDFVFKDLELKYRGKILKDSNVKFDITNRRNKKWSNEYIFHSV